MNFIPEYINEKVCGCNKSIYCNRVEFKLPKNERYIYTGIYFGISLILRYVLPLLIGFLVITDVGYLYITYPFATLFGYLPAYLETGIEWILIVNIIAVTIFYIFAFYACGFRCLIPIVFSLIGALLTIPAMGSFQAIGVVINGILNIIPWELINLKSFMSEGMCDFPKVAEAELK